MKAIVGSMVALVAIVAVSAVTVKASQGAKLAPTEREVEMFDDRFAPKDAEVFVGDTLIFVNKGKATHAAISDDKKSFDTGDVKPGERSKAIKFDKEATISYACPHDKKMTGKIVVKKAK
jgi:plastocyanin